MAYTTCNLAALAGKFNEKNDTNYKTSWLFCANCEYWLSSPMFLHKNEEYYCALCSITFGGGTRAKMAEILLQKCQFPCINEKCPSWFSFENIEKHEEVCKFNVFVCSFCTDRCTEKEYLDHLIGSHSAVCGYIKITNSSLKMEFKNNSESKEKIMIGDYDSGAVAVHAKIEKDMNLVFLNFCMDCIGLASTEFDDTMKIGTGLAYKLEKRINGIFCTTRWGKCMSLQHLGCLVHTHNFSLAKCWESLEINITFENHGYLLKIADCPICLSPMKESIVLCENGHPVCSSCALKIEKCAVCRMAMSKGTLRLSDVFQNIPNLEKVDIKPGSSSWSN